MQFNENAINYDISDIK